MPCFEKWFSINTGGNGNRGQVHLPSSVWPNSIRKAVVFSLTLSQLPRKQSTVSFLLFVKLLKVSPLPLPSFRSPNQELKSLE